MTPPVLLEVHALEGGYGGAKVLNGIDMAVQEGQCVGLFGPNGHGKTTLLRTISGLESPWRGDILFRGRRIDGASPRHIVSIGVIHVPQGNTLFPDMTVGENLMLGAYAPRCRRGAKANLEQVYELFPKLADRRGQLCRTLSGGERQMVAIGIGVMGDLELLLLDEPTLGLAPRLKDELCAAIGRLTASGLPLIIVEQHIEFLLDLSERLYLINHGEVAMSMAADERMDHAQIMNMYFGEA